MTESPAPERLAHTLVRASAGAGKTYRLTSRYLALLRVGSRPGSILATTFTRKAAGEISGRVLLRLAAAVTDATQRRELAGALRDEGLPDRLAQVSAQDCQAMLAELVASLDRVSISTIDSFFNRVVNGFRLELGLPLDPVLTDDGSALAREIRGRAIEAMLAEAVGEDSDGLETLLALLRQLHHDQQKRSVTATLDAIFTGATGGLFGTFRQARLQERWPALRTRGLLSDEPLSDMIQRVLSSLELLYESLPMTRTGPNKGLPKKNWLNSYESMVDGLVRRDWESLAKNTLIQKLAEGAEKYDSVSISTVWFDLLGKLAVHVGPAFIAQYNAQTQSTWKLLDRYADHFERACAQQRVLLFADLTDALARRLDALDDTLRGELAFRLDGKVEHLLLDEFQDTSVDQYSVLAPIIDEITADETTGRSFFCVGDPKQSIYGWRGGWVELFDRVHSELLPRGLREERAATSYRSSAVVLDAVNQVFTHLEDVGPWQKDRDAVERMTGGYDPHAPASQNEDLVGYVELSTATGDGEGEKQNGGAAGYWAGVARRLKLLYDAAPAASIAVLTRTNAEAGRVLHALRMAEIPASGEGGAALTDHPAVNTLLAALTLADHPGDTAAAFRVAESPLGTLLRFSDYSSQTRRETVARCVRRAWLDQGCGALITSWTAALAPSCDAAGLRRLMQLSRVAEAFRPAAALRPGEFVRHVRRAVVTDADASRVRVMTIHRAKGLEFDAVVLPALHGTLRFQPTVLEDRDPETGQLRAVYRAGNETVRKLADDLESLYQRERQRFVYEQLCTLYVAMTRARQALYLMLPPAQPGRPDYRTKQTCASLLLETLAPDADPCQTHATLFASGDASWHRGLTREAREGVDREPATPLRWTLAHGVGRGRSVVYPSAAVPEVSVHADALLGAGDDTADGRKYGRRWHAWLERVGFVDEPGFDVQDLGLSPDGADRVAALLADPDVASVFSRRGAAGLRCEWRFAYSDADGRGVRGDIDRLVWWTDDGTPDGTPIRAEVIDFKSDTLPDDVVLTERVEHHRPQLEAYRNAAAAYLKLPVEAVAMTLLFTAGPRVAGIA